MPTTAWAAASIIHVTRLAFDIYIALCLQSVAHAKKKIVHYTTMDNKKRANAAFLISAYAVSTSVLALPARPCLCASRLRLPASRHRAGAGLVGRWALSAET